MDKEIAKKLGLTEDATTEEIVGAIDNVQKENKALNETNKSLVKTNETLATSEAGQKARADELEKNYKELLEKKQDEPDKKPKSDIERLCEIK